MKFLITIICFCFLSYSEKLADHVRINSTVFEKDTSVNNLDEKTLQNHLAIFEKINNSSKKLRKSNVSILKGDTVNVSQGYGRTVYHNIRSMRISSIKIDKHDIPRSILFNTTSRNFTKEESKYFSTTSKLPESYCTISKEDAIARASDFLGTILGEDEKNRFDSIYVSMASFTGKNYVVYFNVKTKNDIWDSKSAEVCVNANTGEISSYTGDGKGEHPDFNYVPKITKEQVLQMYDNERLKFNAEILINKVALSYVSHEGKYRWMWRIYGMRRDKQLSTSAYMFIDSESGKVLKERME